MAGDGNVFLLRSAEHVPQEQALSAAIKLFNHFEIHPRSNSSVEPSSKEQTGTGDLSHSASLNYLRDLYVKLAVSLKE